jgi:hypothetical protein
MVGTAFLPVRCIFRIWVGFTQLFEQQLYGFGVGVGTRLE